MCEENSYEEASDRGGTDADKCSKSECVRVFCWMVDCRLNQGLSLDSSHWGLHSHNLTNLPRVIGFFLSRLWRRSLPTSSLLPWWECEPSALSGWDLHQSHWAVGVLPVPCWLLLCREDRQLQQVPLSTWILLPWWYPKTFHGCVSSWIYWKNVHATNTTNTEIWLRCTPRYKACHSVSLSSWILQPRAYDSESGQLLALSSRTLLWEGEADQSVWKMQGWSVTVSLFISTKDTITAIVSQCQDFVLCTSLFVSWGWQSSPKQSGRLRGQEQRVHIKHEAPQLNTSHISHYFSSPPHFHSRTSAPTAAFR